MRAFAERHFALSIIDKDGVSRREMLESVLARCRAPDRIAFYESELFCPPPPAALNYVWRAFLRLHGRRGSNGFGPNPISWPDIDAFVRQSGMRLAPWEIEIIEELDDLFRSEQAKAMKSDA